MKYLGNGQYQIRNKRTGEVRTVTKEELPKYGLQSSPSAEKGTYGSQPKEMTGIRKTAKDFSGILDSLGLGVIPGAAASAYELPGFITRGLKPRSVKEAQGDNPFLTSQKAESISKLKAGDKSELIKQPIREGAGLLSWMIPGGAGAKVGGRALLGAAQGATYAMSQDEKPEEVATSAGAGAVLNTILPGLTSVLGKSGRWISQKIPADIREKVIEAPARKAKELTEQGIRYMIGHRDLDYALSNKIIDKKSFKGVNIETINDALDKTYSLIKNKDDELQNILRNKDNMVPYGPVKEKISSIIDKAPPDMDMPEKSAIIKWLDDRLMEGLPSGNRRLDTLAPFVGGEMLGSLAALNELKRSLYKENAPVYRRIYSFLNDYIGSGSGVPDKVKSINKELGSLVRIKDNLIKSQEKQLPEKLVQEKIEDAIEKAATGDVPSLNSLLQLLVVSTLPATTSVGNAVFPVGGPVGGLGASYFMYRTLKNIVDKPQVKKRIMEILEKSGQKSSQVSEALKLPVIGDIMRGLAVKSPAYLQRGDETQSEVTY